MGLCYSAKDNSREEKERYQNLRQTAKLRKSEGEGPQASQRVCAKDDEHFVPYEQIR